MTQPQEQNPNQLALDPQVLIRTLRETVQALTLENVDLRTGLQQLAGELEAHREAQRERAAVGLEGPQTDT